MGKLGETGRTRHLFMLRLACHSCTVRKERWGEEDGGGQTAKGGGMHDLKVGGTEHTYHHTPHMGWGVRLRGWLTAEADWLGWMASKTAVPFPCIGLQGARDQHSSPPAPPFCIFER